jgi:predicted nucleic acid-binding protein
MGDGGQRVACPLSVALGDPERRGSGHQAATNTADRGREFLEQLATLNFKIDRPPLVVDFPRLHSLALTYRLTAYDAAYLDLAKRLSLPLATNDGDLRKAARGEHLEVV